MDAKSLTDLPLLFQVIAGFGLFFGTFMLAVGGWFWKVVKPKLPVSITGSDSPAVQIPISSAQILDHATFEKLSRSINDLIDYLRTKDDDTDRELQRGFDRLDKTLTDVCKELERNTKAVERVEKQIGERTLL